MISIFIAIRDITTKTIIATVIIMVDIIGDQIDAAELTFVNIANAISTMLEEKYQYLFLKRLLQVVSLN
jgi:hypothetical protein